MTHWTWTYRLIDDDGNLSSRLIADHDDERVEEIQARFVEFLRGCGFAVDHHGDEALSDVLRERIDTALEYIAEMRECPPKSVRWNLVLADLTVISGILEGRQEADR